MNENKEYQTLKAKALRALARRDHGREELKRKLLQSSEEHELIEKILDECQQHNWLNEIRFVDLYIRSRAQKYYGPRKIRYELQQRGTPNDLIENGFACCELDWKELAEIARQHKFGKEKPDSWLEKGKQGQYLYQRGFE